MTMIQRSPTYIVAMPNGDKTAETLSNYLPRSMVHPILRWRNVLFSKLLYLYLLYRPAEKNRATFIRIMRKALPRHRMNDEEFARHFTPAYNPWEQRVCLSPDGDFFRSIADQRATVVTQHIQRLEEGGVVRLVDGKTVNGVDVIVKATGLEMQRNFPMAGIDVRIDGTPYLASDHFVYKGCMLDGVPNFAFVRGYFTESWTLKADLVCLYITR